ncbi:hypothetical protein [Streptomyces sp. NPDC127098]|uniref:hypothetical protein n=1 Tax=Streptomyces sp. NPDC127098 TaxID=3347137 RepID=UPI00365E6340
MIGSPPRSRVEALDTPSFALLKNRYDVELIRDGERWVARRTRVDNARYTGDPTAIFA